MLLLVSVIPLAHSKDEWNLQIKVNQNIDNLSHLNSLVSSLAAVGNDEFGTPQPELVKFKLNSPPELELLADPAWLSIFITILFGFKSEVKKMIRIYIGRMKGFSKNEKIALEYNTLITLSTIDKKNKKLILHIQKQLNADSISIRKLKFTKQRRLRPS